MNEAQQMRVELCESNKKDCPARLTTQKILDTALHVHQNKILSRLKISSNQDSLQGIRRIFVIW